jgi:hypothetical protein
MYERPPQTGLAIHDSNQGPALSAWLQPMLQGQAWYRYEAKTSCLIIGRRLAPVLFANLVE